MVPFHGNPESLPFFHYSTTNQKIPDFLLGHARADFALMTAKHHPRGFPVVRSSPAASAQQDSR